MWNNTFLGEGVEEMNKGLEGGGVNFSLLAGGYDNKWFNLLATSGNDINEWSVFANFSCCR